MGSINCINMYVSDDKNKSSEPKNVNSYETPTAVNSPSQALNSFTCVAIIFFGYVRGIVFSISYIICNLSHPEICCFSVFCDGLLKPICLYYELLNSASNMKIQF